ncbi:hypothetical protein BCR34DRAFT_636035, partial [Clohesyomyces aquaticus]
STTATEPPEQPALYQNRPWTDPQEIRVLIIHPGTGSDDIRCDLEYVLLSNETRFEALSYAWGSSLKPHHVICNEGAVPVTESLSLH